MSVEQTSIPVDQLHIGPLRFGEILLSHHLMSPDKQTLDAIFEGRDLLRSKGLLILDVHNSALDIVNTGIAAVTSFQPDHIAGPVLASMFSHPIYGPFLKRIQRLEPMTLYPVIRGEENKKGKHNGGLSREEIKKALKLNNEYLQGISSHLEIPSHVGIVAPWGSRTNRVLRGGVVKLLRREKNIVFSYSRVKKGLTHLPDTTTFFKLVSPGFDLASTHQEMEALLIQEFDGLEQLALSSK